MCEITEVPGHTASARGLTSGWAPCPPPGPEGPFCRVLGQRLLTETPEGSGTEGTAGGDGGKLSRLPRPPTPVNGPPPERATPAHRCLQVASLVKGWTREPPSGQPDPGSRGKTGGMGDPSPPAWQRPEAHACPGRGSRHTCGWGGGSAWGASAIKRQDLPSSRSLGLPEKRPHSRRLHGPLAGPGPHSVRLSGPHTCRPAPHARGHADFLKEASPSWVCPLLWAQSGSEGVPPSQAPPPRPLRAQSLREHLPGPRFPGTWGRP